MTASQLSATLETLLPDAEPSQVAFTAARLLAYSREPWALSDYETVTTEMRTLVIRQQVVLEQFQQAARDLIDLCRTVPDDMPTLVAAARRFQLQTHHYVLLMMGGARFDRVEQ